MDSSTYKLPGSFASEISFGYNKDDDLTLFAFNVVEYSPSELKIDFINQNSLQTTHQYINDQIRNIICQNLNTLFSVHYRGYKTLRL